MDYMKRSRVKEILKMFFEELKLKHSRYMIIREGPNFLNQPTFEDCLEIFSIVTSEQIRFHDYKKVSNKISEKSFTPNYLGNNTDRNVRFAF